MKCELNNKLKIAKMKKIIIIITTNLIYYLYWKKQSLVKIHNEIKLNGRKE